jgi:hypothetical protein
MNIIISELYNLKFNYEVWFYDDGRIL